MPADREEPFDSTEEDIHLVSGETNAPSGMVVVTRFKEGMVGEMDWRRRLICSGMFQLYKMAVEFVQVCFQL